jgi:hypothetical protein
MKISLVIPRGLAAGATIAGTVQMKGKKLVTPKRGLPAYINGNHHFHFSG